MGQVSTQRIAVFGSIFGAIQHSDYLLLIRARLYGWSGTNADRAKRLQLSEQTIANLMKGKAKGLSMNQLKAIARKAGVTAKL